MKHIARFFAAILLASTFACAPTLWGQAPGGLGKQAAQAKKRIQGYTRIHPKTGQPVQVRPYKRRPPQPKPVEVKSYEREGRPVMGHHRRRPGSTQPPNVGPHVQSSLPLWRTRFSGGEHHWV